MSKYKNKKTIVDGIEFDSILESRRYIFLKDLADHGTISRLELQTEYELIPSFKAFGKTYRKTCYRADFTYIYNGRIVCEDVKGSLMMVTREFKLKQKMMAYMLGIPVRIVTAKDINKMEE